MLQLTSDHGQQSTAAVVAKNATLTEQTFRRLNDQYGEFMSSAQVSCELDYTETYFRKKIGNSRYQHLAWVKAISPSRKKRGRFWVYGTDAVASYLGRGA
ncbi:hypothetical protein [Pseudomonas sp. LS-2]|uniref:hypothetical protein n=1 Tax=Pseudomonas sp. LS-2 TaxID=2315859 RepID=UPI00105888A4|nr:hypothetical protein [Pseudomonas sp. LS-2]